MGDASEEVIVSVVSGRTTSQEQRIKKPPRPNRSPGGTHKRSQTEPSQRHARRGRRTTTTCTRIAMKREGCVAGGAAMENGSSQQWEADGRRGRQDRTAGRQTGARQGKQAGGTKRGKLPASKRGARQEGGQQPGARGGAERGTSRRAEGRTAGKARGTDTGASGQPQGRKQRGKGAKARHAADGAARARHEKMRSIRLTDGKMIYTISKSADFFYHITLNDLSCSFTKLSFLYFALENRSPSTFLYQSQEIELRSSMKNPWHNIK